MTNHPGRKPGSAIRRMTSAQLRDLLARSQITQARAASLAGVSDRTLRQYLEPEGATGHRAMPASASGLLCMSLITLGAPAGLLAPWLHPDIAAKLGWPHEQDVPAEA